MVSGERFLGGVEDELDVTAHGVDAVVAPYLVQTVEVVDLCATRVELEQTGQWHDANLMAEA